MQRGIELLKRQSNGDTTKLIVVASEDARATVTPIAIL
jgi:hypothetical protein